MELIQEKSLYFRQFFRKFERELQKFSSISEKKQLVSALKENGEFLVEKYRTRMAYLYVIAPNGLQRIELCLS